MKTTITLVLLLFCFSLSGQNEKDPYWDFNQSSHFKPHINKGEFYSFSGFDFGWLVLEPMSVYVKDIEHEIERGKSFSHPQKALYYWWYLDAQVTNGGFGQFYSNGYGHYVPTIIKGLDFIGDTEMAELVKKADVLYQKEKYPNALLQDSEFQVEGTSSLDDKYYSINDKTMGLIENYFKKHPNEICLDESGNEFDTSFTGLCRTFHPNQTIKNEFQLEKGVLTGEYKSFYETGALKELIDFDLGKPTGERKEFFENGTLKFEISKDAAHRLFVHQWFYENGNQKKLESSLIENNERKGAYKEWYENGQLSKQGNYKSMYEREGPWLEFYPNGAKKLEAEFVENDFRIINFWNAKGEQTLTNGTGLYVNEYSLTKDKIKRNEKEYKNFKLHGVQKRFTNGILTSYREMKDGIDHGYYRTYYNNGNIKQESLYENGKGISIQNFRKFKNPKVKTQIISRVCAGCLQNQEDYQLPDNNPKPLNKNEIANNFKVETSIFDSYGDDYSLSYGYYLFVDEKGNVQNIEFAVASNLWLTNELNASIVNLKFEPAIKEGKPIKSIHYVRYELQLTE